jgi:hypothetical protein
VVELQLPPASRTAPDDELRVTFILYVFVALQSTRPAGQKLPAFMLKLAEPVMVSKV